jgi:cell surface protein SprA
MEIWPMENDVDLNIQDFVDAKIRRDKSPDKLYKKKDDQSRNTNKSIYIKGRPSLGNITTIMIGVRNVLRKK